MSKLFEHDGKLHITHNYEEVNLSPHKERLEDIDEKLTMFNSRLDSYVESLVPDIVTITVTGGAQDYEFSYDAEQGPDPDGYDITVYLRERYTQTFSSARDEDATWDVTDYRIGDNPASWPLGQVRSSTAAHGGKAPHYFEWIRGGVTTTINVTIIDQP